MFLIFIVLTPQQTFYKAIDVCFFKVREQSAGLFSRYNTRDMFVWAGTSVDSVQTESTLVQRQQQRQRAAAVIRYCMGINKGHIQ